MYRVTRHKAFIANFTLKWEVPVIIVTGPPNGGTFGKC